MTPLWDPVPKNIHFFGKVFGTRLFKHKICKIAQERLCLQRQKKCVPKLPKVRGMGPPQGPTFVNAVTTLNKTKNQKLEKRQVLSRTGIVINILRFTACAKLFIAQQSLTKLIVFSVFAFLFC